MPWPPRSGILVVLVTSMGLLVRRMSRIASPLCWLFVGLMKFEVVDFVEEGAVS